MAELAQMAVFTVGAQARMTPFHFFPLPFPLFLFPWVGRVLCEAVKLGFAACTRDLNPAPQAQMTQGFPRLSNRGFLGSPE